jgi:hypothetical protein
VLSGLTRPQLSITAQHLSARASRLEHCFAGMCCSSLHRLRSWWHHALLYSELSTTKVCTCEYHCYILYCTTTVIPEYYCSSAILHFFFTLHYTDLSASYYLSTCESIHVISANTGSTSLLTPTMHDSLSLMHVVSGSRRPAYTCTSQPVEPLSIETPAARDWSERTSLPGRSFLPPAAAAPRALIQVSRQNRYHRFSLNTPVYTYRPPVPT